MTLIAANTFATFIPMIMTSIFNGAGIFRSPLWALIRVARFMGAWPPQTSAMVRPKRLISLRRKLILGTPPADPMKPEHGAGDHDIGSGAADRH